MSTIEKHGLKFLFLNDILVSIEGDWQNVSLQDFHRTILSYLSPSKGALLLQDTAHMNLKTKCTAVDCNEFDMAKPGVDLSPLPVMEHYEKLARAYLQVLRSFVAVMVSFEESKTQYCPGCLCALIQVEHYLVCSTCTFKLAASLTPVNGCGSTINVSHELKNFRDVLDFFEGQIELPTSRFAQAVHKLDLHFMSIGTRSRHKIQRQDCQPSGRKKNTSRVLMTRALKVTKFEGQHNICPSNFVNLFMIRYWGWKKPDLTAIRDKLLTNQARVLNVLSPILLSYGRKTNIGQWIMLEEQLKVLGCTFHIQYFKAHKTEGVVDIHREIMRKAHEASGVV